MGCTEWKCSSSRPAHRCRTVTRDVTGQTTVHLAPLESPDINPAAPLELEVPINPAASQYYTVEYRRNTGWDAGLPHDAVLVHQVRPLPKHKNFPTPFIVDPFGNAAIGHHDAGWVAGEAFADPSQNISITVESMDAGEAVITVRRGTGAVPPAAQANLRAGAVDTSVPTFQWQELTAERQRLQAGAAVQLRGKSFLED